MASEKKLKDLPIGLIRELNKNKPRSPMYNAIDLVIDDITPFVGENFDLSKNIYTLGQSNFSYLKAFCKNFFEYFKDEILILNYGDRIEKIKYSNIPGNPEEYIQKAIDNSNMLIPRIMNFECIINDSLNMIKKFNGEVSAEYIRDFYKKKYKIKDEDLTELPRYHNSNRIRSHRIYTISFKDYIPYGPIEIKNAHKDYNINFYTGAIKHLSNLLDIPDDLRDRMIKEILKPEYKVSWGYKNRLSELLIVTTDREGKDIKLGEETKEALIYTIANSIGRFFFYGWHTDDNSEYMKIRRELEPYYLRYLEKRNKAA
tara:strand:+ start:1170 stop:2114 length:945 start_codon:yes stop_codon:yes gene_type:complete